MHRDKFHWVSTDSPESEWPTLTVAQHWSKGGLTPEIKASIDKILGGGLAEKIIPYTPTLGPPPNLSSCEAGKISDKGGGPPPNGIRQTQAGWWVLEGDNFISKWVEDEGRLDHDQWLLERIRPLAGAGDTVIEVGAYIGDHTQWFLNRGCRVIAYEPNPQACECLRRNCPGAEVHEVALWHEPAQLEFENGGVKENPGASWVVEHFAGRPIKAIPLDFEPVERVDLMMIDAEGSELFVLQGALKTIRKHRPSLIIELNSGAMKRYGYSQEAIFDFLRGEGYTWHPIQPLMVADPPQYDIIARPTRAERADIKPEADRVLADGLANAVERLRVHAETGTNERKQVMFRLSRAGLTPRYPGQKRKKKAKYNAKQKQQQQESLYETQGTL
jgi:FkbM family methyltransferase